MAFHRVLDDAALEHTDTLPGMIVCKSTFDAAAAYIAGHYGAVDPARSSPDERPSRVSFAFTFDDGWTDNASIMLAIAAKHDIPVTVFACTGVQGEIAPFWPERFVAKIRASGNLTSPAELEAKVDLLKCEGREKREEAGRITELLEPPRFFEGDRLLSAEETRRMHEAGVRFGAHTRTHVMLTEASDEEAWDEIAGSKQDLEQVLGSGCELFAYPNGNTAARERAMVRNAGFRLAFTTERGAWTAASDLLAVPRMCAWEGSFAGLSGRFTSTMFEYTMIWRTWRATVRGLRRAAPAAEQVAQRAQL
jgi:peptidoglycan/xylan/chitin deacetylase (PgdA/CDA1 family)